MVIVEFEDDKIRENLQCGHRAFPSGVGSTQASPPSVQSGSTLEGDKKMSANNHYGTSAQRYGGAYSIHSGSSVDDDDSKMSIRPGAFAVASAGISVSKSGDKVDDDNLKMTLAMRTSEVVSLPGAYQDHAYDAAQEKSKNDAKDSSNYRRMKAAQKARGYCDNEVHRPECGSMDEEDVLDDFNERMNTFKQDTEKTNAKEDDHLAKRARCRLIIAVAVIFIVVSVVVGTVVGVMSNKRKGGKNDVTSAQPESSVNKVEECYSRPLNEQSLRFKALHTEVLSQRPEMDEALNTEWSSTRASLCWLADNDSFQIDTDSVFFPRFVAAIIYYHFVGVASSAESSTHPLTVSGWLGDVPVCQWQGIKCESDKDSITSLDLSSMQLAGTSIPTELFLLTNLTEISLSDNQITGRIPAGISSLAQLKTFDIADNVIAGQIPSELFDLVQLENLNLLGNSLSGTFPEQIADAPSLQNVAIAGFGMTGTLPDLNSLTRLRALLLIDVLGLRGEFPNITKCSNLESLALESTAFVGPIPTFLFSLSKLGTIPTEIGQLSRLRIFEIVDHSFDGAIPTEIGLLSHLERLRLSPSLTREIMTGTLPTEVCSFPNLTYVIVACEQCSCCNDCMTIESWHHS